MRALLLILTGLAVQAADYTVCASGCYTTNLQTAIDDAARGDTITLKAGETFEGNFRLKWKGAGSGYITIRSSRWAELPPPGTRLTSAHSALLPKIQPNSSTVAAVYAVPEEVYEATANTSTDVITTPTHGFSDGDPVTQRYDTGTPYSPFVLGTVYYVRDATSTTFKVAATPGGAALDISGTSTTNTWRWQTLKAGHNYKFHGIEFTKKAGQNTEYWLVEIGRGEEHIRAGIPSNYVFDHVYVHGIRDEEGPRICMLLNARNVTIVDSTIENCIQGGQEGKAIAFVSMPGPMLLRNNYLAAGAINMLMGGGGIVVYPTGLVNGDEGQIVIEGNHFTRPLWMKWTSGTGGAGAPAANSCPGPLDTVNWYLNISNGQWYTCSGASGTAWSTGPTCAEGEYYKRTDVAGNCGAGACWSCNGSGAFASYGTYRGSSYGVKNLFEIKNGKNIRIRGNVFQNNWVNSDQNGTAVWVSQVSQGNANTWVRGENIVFENNWIIDSPAGFRVATEGVTSFGVPNSRVVVKNNAGRGVGTTAYASVLGNGTGLSVGGACVDCEWSHNTFYNSMASGGYGMIFDGSAVTRLRFADNLTARNLYGVRGYSGGECGGISTSVVDSDDSLVNNILVDNQSQGGNASIGSCATNTKYIAGPYSDHVTSSTNLRLKTTSPYSASCASGCDFTATDGKDLGADIDAIDSATGGAASGAPWLGGSVRVDSGSTKVIVRYTAPDSSACTVKLYTNLARTTLHGDTDSGGEQTDSRSGSITNGPDRQLVLGVNTALTASTQYWSTITCGTSVALVPVRTVAAGSGTYYIAVQFASATTGEYSSNADMSSPTTISSAANWSIPVSSGAVIYYRQTGGAIQARVAP